MYRVAVAGATGAVGMELLKVLEVRKFPVSSIILAASSRSAGKMFCFRGEETEIETLVNTSFENIDIAFFSCGSQRSIEFAPYAVKAGAVVIDNSSAFRMKPDVPLIIPEVNPEAAFKHKGIIANPNCSAILLLMALKPLLSLSPIRRVIVSTYQAASGAGASAMEELRTQAAAHLAGNKSDPVIFPHPIAFNVFSHNSKINEAGYNEEEWKIIEESRKILDIPDFKLSATCVRTPVFRAHSESVNIEFEKRPSLNVIREALDNFPGVTVVDDREKNYFPMPIDASGKNEVLVGRIRNDPSHDQAIELFLSGDQILKGAALNAVQIAELLISKNN